MRGIDKEILRLSVPAIVSNVTVPLLGLCDTAIAGHLGSEVFLGAIAIGSLMLNIVFWLFGFLRAGTTGLTAIALGRGSEPEIRKVFSRAFAIAMLGGSLIILLRVPVMEGLLRVVDAAPEVTHLARSYFSICVWGAPAILGVMAISGWFVGMQSTTYPMAIAISVNLINIALSLLLAFGLKMGFSGVAAGSLLANWLGLAIALVCARRFRRGRKLWCPMRDIIRRGGLGKFFSVNANLFFRSACIIMVSLGVTAAGARLGALTLAINAIMMQFFQLFSFFMDGFAFSAEALVGRSAGAQDYPRLCLAVRALLRWTLGMALLFTLLYAAGCGPIAAILTDADIISAGVEDLRPWIALLPLLSAWAFIYDGFYIGLTRTRRMLLATLCSTLLFYAVAFIDWPALSCGDGLHFGISGNRYLWSAFLSYLTLRGVILALLWSSTMRRIKRPT